MPPNELLAALVLFMFAGSITPGPNTMLLFTSGLNFGARATVPHMFGVAFGFAVMVIAVGLGLASLFRLYPVIDTVLRVAGSVYLLYLAWRVVQASEVKEGKCRARPMTFLEAALFQWINPKAWVLAMTAIIAYAPAEAGLSAIALVALVVVMVNIPCASVWILFGAGIRRFLSNPRALAAFNLAMAVLLVLSIWPMLRPLLP